MDISGSDLRKLIIINLFIMLVSIYRSSAFNTCVIYTILHLFNHSEYNYYLFTVVINHKIQQVFYLQKSSKRMYCILVCTQFNLFQILNIISLENLFFFFQVNKFHLKICNKRIYSFCTLYLPIVAIHNIKRYLFFKQRVLVNAYPPKVPRQ